MSNLAALPISSAAFSGESAASPASFNKYQYPEFAGWSGELYLKKLLRQILPMALYRTWEIFVDHQAPGNDCYLGVTHLAEIAGRAPRTMEKNLASLCAKQLLVERAERKVFRNSDGSLRSKMVVVKDFFGLYALAHEYHEWLNGDEYIAPDREVVDLMERSPGLVAKLRRFDNYRRLLYNRLPGPLPQTREEDRWFTEYQADHYFNIAVEKRTGEAELLDKSAIPAKNPATYLPEDMSRGSAKRITETSYNNREERESFDSVSSLSSKKSLKDEKELDELDGLQQGTHHNVLKASTTEPSSVLFPSAEHSSHLSQQEDIDLHTEPTKTHRPVLKVTDSRPEGYLPHNAEGRNHDLSGHLLASSFIREIALPFGDRNQKATTTRVLSLLKKTHLEQPAEVLLCLVRAYVVARDTRTIRPEHCHPETGRVNRIPLFCAMFQHFVEACTQGSWWDYSWQQMEAELAGDDLLERWWNENRLLVGELSDCFANERNANESSQQDLLCSGETLETKPLAEEALSSRTPHLRLSQTDEQREERANRTHKVLQHLLNAGVPIQNPIILWEHLRCGCPLYHQRSGKEVCALCCPDPAWPEEVLALLHSLVHPQETESAKDKAPEEVSIHAQASLEAKEEPFSANKATGWIERDEAYACGTRLLETMTSNGYLVEVYLRFTGLRYQVVLRSGDNEFLYEMTEQVEYLIEQAQNGAL